MQYTVEQLKAILNRDGPLNLSHADLSRASLTGVDLLFSRYDMFTKWPDGFDPNATVAKNSDY
jgi:hypothetical protein